MCMQTSADWKNTDNSRNSTHRKQPTESNTRNSTHKIQLTETDMQADLMIACS